MKYTFKNFSIIAGTCFAFGIAFSGCGNSADMDKKASKSAEQEQLADENRSKDRSKIEDFKKEVSQSLEEPYMLIMPEKLNKQIASVNGLRSAEDVMQFYVDQSVKNPGDIEIKSRKIDDGFFEVTMIHDNTPGTNQKSEKVVIKVAQNGKGWDVNEIKRQWKCTGAYDDKPWGVNSCR